jgi:hypothetical protein
MSAYAGSEWIISNVCKEPSPLGIEVADLLGDVFAGIYHLNPKFLHRVDWSNKDWIVYKHDWKSLSTVDYDELTRLVVLAHDRMIRVQISASTHHVLELMFHKRKQRDGSYALRCPTIEDHIKAIRDDYLEVAESA